MATYDLVITGAGVVRPKATAVENADIGVADGRIVAVAPSLDRSSARRVIDADGLLAFPGSVDAHTHWGIYNPLADDAVTESRAAAQGGTTTAITYMRTGQHYLDRGGPYAEFFPEVLRLTEGRAHVDYAYHLAPMERRHIEEIPTLIERFGVTSFKIFMFYGGHGLHGKSEDQSSFLMTPPGERYDLAHFEFVMRGVQEARERFPAIADRISLSLHCETAEIMTAYTERVEQDGTLGGLAAYSASRPPHSEGLAVTIAAYLAHATGLTTINLLHLSSATAVEAALAMAAAFPEIDFRREVTIGHLLADIDTANGLYGKVNPPLRPRHDVEALWDSVLAGDIDWVVSDHACCRPEMKLGTDPTDVWQAKSGFGGTEYLLAGVLSEGTRRGLSPNRVAELVAWRPSRRYGLMTKGDIAPGFDADIVLLDPDERWTVQAAESESSQGYSPLEGVELTGRVRDVFLRGGQILETGRVVGEPAGRYIHRPTTAD
jgi:allantoinase